MRVVSYARVSLDTVADSISAQHDAVERWAAASGHEVVGRRGDLGRSGLLPAEQRQGLLDALNLIRSSQAEAIAVRSLDRLARALHIQEAILAQIWSFGGHVWDASGSGREILQDDPDDPQRTFLRQIVGAAIQYDRSLVIKRMRDGIRARRTENGGGRYVGGNKLRYGWRVQEGTGPLRSNGLKASMWVRDDEEFEACRIAAEMRAAGALLREIAVELDARGYRTRTGKKIRSQSVQIAIHNFQHPPGTYKSMEQLAREQPLRRRYRIAPIVTEQELRSGTAP